MDRLMDIEIKKLIENQDKELTQQKVLNAITYVENGEVKLKDNIPDISLLKPYLNYQTGGVRKEGRGVLDEYFTDTKIVDRIGKILELIYDKNNPLKILEPSVGDGNFLRLGKEFPNALFTGYEINPITAKITKAYNPNSEVFNTSFETNFIEENGKKKLEVSYKNSYDMVVGNPPYGLHRGFYKGLGEEPNISRYEDYFVKRSLDVLKEGGIVAMVLPSGWINRQKKLNQANLVTAYRLPSGAFKGTQIGTDIIILEKDSKAKDVAINNYFIENPEYVLGKIEMTTNRFGREEEIVKGDLFEALSLLDKHIEANKDLLPKYTYTKTEEVQAEQVTEQVTEQVETELEDYKQVTPEQINSNHIKYEFNKEDEIIAAGNSLKNEISNSKELEALKNTFYDGTLLNPTEHEEFSNFYKGRYYHDFYYIEGNIIEKLDQLEIDYNSNYINEEKYNKQKQLLLENLPKAQTLDNILISPNHEFVHDFIIGEIEKVNYNPYTKQSTKTGEIVTQTLAQEFKDFVSRLDYKAFAGSSSWEVRAYVDNVRVTGHDRKRNALERERRKEAANNLFEKFLREELPKDVQERFIKEFNRTYNSVNIPDYSKFPLFSQIHKNFKGKPLELSSVQQAGIGQLTTKGVGILAHEVGFGKTLSGIISMQEALHRGNARRPLIVVPNENILKQWVDTIYETIPNAKVNVLGNLGVKYDLSNFQVNDGEISLVTYSGFNNIGFSEEIIENLSEKFSYISEQETKSVKATAREEELETSKIEELQGILKKGRVYDWEEFGFDHLTFDEVHNANHIVSKVRIEDRGFASDFRSQQQATSLLGINTWMASQYLQETNDGRNVTLLSATPFTNKPLEYYSILSLVANDRLEELGFFNVNTFFETFMEADNEMEIDALGEVKFKSAVNRFKNNNLFQKLLREFIDIKGTEDNPELERPNRINKEFRISQNELTKREYDKLNLSYDSEADGAILTHILDSRKIAISPYLSPYYNDANPTNKEFIENSPKLATTIEFVKQNIKDNPSAGQIIYSELGIEVFPKIKEYLINEGIAKENEIHIITGKTTKPRRIKYQNEFNEGKAKIILGSSAIQEGMNLQAKTTDMYLLSLPYNFTQLRQVEGRAWRQGNENQNVRINYILTNDSIDVFMLQKLQSKQSRYEAAMMNNENVLDVSDISTAELKTALITDPNIRAEIEVKILEERLKKEKEQHIADQAFVLRKYETFNELSEKLEKAEKEYNSALESDYSWTKQRIPLYKIEIEKLIEKVENEKEVLQKQGVNVQNIEEQQEFTKIKIEEIDEKIEDLKTHKENLIEQYIKEQKENEGKFSLENLLEERHIENTTLFIKEKAPKIENIQERETEEKNKELSFLDLINNNELRIEIEKEWEGYLTEIKKLQESLPENIFSNEHRMEKLIEFRNSYINNLRKENSMFDIFYKEFPNQNYQVELSDLDKFKLFAENKITVEGKEIILSVPKQLKEEESFSQTKEFLIYEDVGRGLPMNFYNEREKETNIIEKTEGGKQEKSIKIEANDKTIQGGENLSLFPPDVMNELTNKEEKIMEQTKGENTTEKLEVVNEREKESNKEVEYSKEEKDLIKLMVKSESPIEEMVEKFGATEKLEAFADKLGVKEELTKAVVIEENLPSYAEFYNELKESYTHKVIEEKWKERIDEWEEAKDNLHAKLHENPEYLQAFKEFIESGEEKILKPSERNLLTDIVKSDNIADTVANHTKSTNWDGKVQELAQTLGLTEEFGMVFKTSKAIVNFVEFVLAHDSKTPKEVIDKNWESAKLEANEAQKELKGKIKEHPIYLNFPEVKLQLEESKRENPKPVKEETKEKAQEREKTQKESPKPYQQANPVQPTNANQRNMTFQEYRAEISIIDAAASIGYEIDKKKGIGKNVEMINKQGDRIVVNNPNNSSLQMYFNRNGGNDRGNLIEFVKQRINEFNPTTQSNNIFAQINSVLANMVGREFNVKHADIVKQIEKAEFKKEDYNLKPLNINEHKEVVFLQKRGLDIATIKEFAPDIQINQNGNFSNIAFPLKNENNQIVGLDIRNFNFKGLAKGGEKEFWTHLKGENPRNIVLGESPIDLMSYHQLASKSGSKLEDTLFISTGGGFSTEKMRSLLEKYPLKEHNYTLAFDNDLQGNIYDIKFLEAAKNEKIDIQRKNGEYIFTTEKGNFSLEEKNVSLYNVEKNIGGERPNNMKLHKPSGKAIDFNEVLMNNTIKNEVSHGREL